MELRREMHRKESPLASHAQPDAGRIYPLTSIRFFAAFSVVLLHATTVFWPGFLALTSHSFLLTFLQRLLYSFSYSVSFFFLLSGYILAVVYLAGGRETGPIGFLKNRFARIYPLYFATLMLDLPWLVLDKVRHLGWRDGLTEVVTVLAAHVAMVQGWYMPRLQGIDDPNWSLSAEAFFYVCFPLVGVGLWKLRKSSHLWCAAWMIYICGTAVSVVTLTQILPDQLHLSTVRVSTFLPLLHLPTFLLGVLLARMQHLRIGSGGQISARQANGSLLLAFCGLLMAVYFSASQSVIRMLFTGMLAPVFGVLIWGLSGAETTLSRWLSVRWLVVLGDASYALYLLHEPMMHFFERFGLQTKPMLFPVYLVLCISLSVSSFYYFETPMRLWLLQRLRTRSRESVEAASAAQ